MRSKMKQSQAHLDEEERQSPGSPPLGPGHRPEAPGSGLAAGDGGRRVGQAAASDRALGAHRRGHTFRAGSARAGGTRPSPPRRAARPRHSGGPLECAAAAPARQGPAPGLQSALPAAGRCGAVLGGAVRAVRGGAGRCWTGRGGAAQAAGPLNWPPWAPAQVRHPVERPPRRHAAPPAGPAAALAAAAAAAAAGRCPRAAGPPGLAQVGAPRPRGQPRPQPRSGRPDPRAFFRGRPARRGPRRRYGPDPSRGGREWAPRRDRRAGAGRAGWAEGPGQRRRARSPAVCQGFPPSLQSQPSRQGKESPLHGSCGETEVQCRKGEARGPSWSGPERGSPEAQTAASPFWIWEFWRGSECGNTQRIPALRPGPCPGFRRTNLPQMLLLVLGISLRLCGPRAARTFSPFPQRSSCPSPVHDLGQNSDWKVRGRGVRLGKKPELLPKWPGPVL